MTKQTDAIVSEISNKRIKDRHLAHFGWEQHLPNSRKRQWIKRFYGDYPETFFFQSINQEPISQDIMSAPTGIPDRAAASLSRSLTDSAPVVH